MVLRARCHSTNAPCFLWWLKETYIHTKDTCINCRSLYHYFCSQYHGIESSLPFYKRTLFFMMIKFHTQYECCAVCAEWGGTCTLFTTHSGKMESYDDRDNNTYIYKYMYICCAVCAVLCSLCGVRWHVYDTFRKTGVVWRPWQESV